MPGLVNNNSAGLNRSPACTPILFTVLDLALGISPKKNFNRLSISDSRVRHEDKRHSQMTLRRFTRIRHAIMVCMVFAGSLVFAEGVSPADAVAYAPVNGMRLYCKIEGDGQPLILLHSAFGSAEMFAPIMPLLSKKHRVIAVDLQG